LATGRDAPKLAAILIVDVVGYSHLMGAGDEGSLILAATRRLAADEAGYSGLIRAGEEGMLKRLTAHLLEAASSRLQELSVAQQPPNPTPAPAPPAPSPRLPTEEIVQLVARGDAFLHTGDVASARLFYEHAASAGDGQAALRMGATFIRPSSIGPLCAPRVAIRPRRACGTTAPAILAR
jgi:hypothetical protein